MSIAGTAIRIYICDDICDKLFALEKYSTTKDKNKMTYLIIPANHPTIPFPLNLEDRVKFILDNIQRETRVPLDVKIKVNASNGKFKDIKYVWYLVEFENSMNKFEDVLKQYGAEKKGGKWIIKVE